MIILSHRGYWKTEKEKNSITAFERSFSMGFGTETDVRDYKSELVISHDIATENCITVDKLFQIYSSYKNPLPLALNIKADGLQEKLKELLIKYRIENYFLFDMSIPDGLIYLKQDFKMFSRQSEHEMLPALYDVVEGVWLDEFHSHWINKDIIEKHLINNKKLCIVSPELHKRQYKSEWEDYKYINNNFRESIMICTDYPEEARSFFNGQC